MKLFLFDAYSLIFRAYYAFIKNPRINSKGQNTSAIFGFINTFEEVVRLQQPTHMAVVFDPPGPNFRHQMYDKYKANRPPAPEDIKLAVPYIKRILAANNVPVVEVEGYEADDVIGTLAKRAEQEGYDVFMMTPDKDYCQLVTDKIRMYKPSRNGNDAEIWGVDEVKREWDVQRVEQVVDILALCGDASDNVPGAEGIGDKTARKLIALYDNVEKFYEHVHELPVKQREKAIASHDSVILSKKLVTIDIHVPVSIEIAQMKVQQPDIEALKAVYDELEFRTLSAKLAAQAQKQTTIQLPTNGTPSTNTSFQPSLFDSLPLEEQPLASLHLDTIATSQHKYYLADTLEQIAQLVERLWEQQEFCFDTETTSLEAYDADLVGISFSFAPNEAYYVPFPANRDDAQRLAYLFKPIFETDDIAKIGQNMKYDIMVLLRYGIRVYGQLFDTMLAHFLIAPDQRHNLDFLSETYLKYKPIAIEELIGEKGNQRSMRQVPMERVKDYACEDADVTYRLKQIFSVQLTEKEMLHLFHEVEMPLVRVLADMETAGVRLDADVLKQFETSLLQRLIVLETDIMQLAGVQFNINSPKQLGEVLFDHLKILPDAKKTSKSEQYATGERDLMKLVDKHPIVNKVMEFRSLKKLLSTYVEALPERINRRTGRVHTSYHQAGAYTGRLSSNNPNLQNIPIKTEDGREIRKAFVAADDNHVLISADYSQIELRVIAHLSNDPNMIEAFKRGHDIHAATAALIFNIPIEQVTREQRRQAKSANFGIVYGISAFGLSDDLNISRADAKFLIDNYFKNYPGVRTLMDKNIAFARDKGYVLTLMGRRTAINDINSRNGMIRSSAERFAINAPIQGSAADIIKIAMIRIQQRLRKEKLQSRMILQVHDELVFDVLNEELEAMTQLVRDEMQNALLLNVPLVVDIGVGKNWLEAH